MKPTDAQVRQWVNDSSEGLTLHDIAILGYEAGRKEAIEKCAKVCEDPANIRFATFQGLAEEIRSLK